MISKDASLVFFLSVYLLLNTLQTSDYDVIFDFCVDSASLEVQRHHDLIKVRKRLLGYVETIQLILVVTDKKDDHASNKKHIPCSDKIFSAALNDVSIFKKDSIEENALLMDDPPKHYILKLRESIDKFMS